MFKIGKKEEKKECCCSCSAEAVQAKQEKQSGGIKVLGGGCAKCHELTENTKAALAGLGIAEDVELITDFAVIAAYGVMSTPALVVDNKVLSCGKVLKPSEIVELLTKVRG